MTQEITSKIRKLESFLDLDTLQYGDVIEIKYKFYPYDENKFKEVKAMFYVNPLFPNSQRLSFLAHLEKSSGPQIFVYQIRARDAEVEEGKLLMHQKVTKTLRYNSDMELYKYFKTELEKHTNIIK